MLSVRPAIIGAAEDILAGLEGPQGGIGEIQRRYGLNMNIAADGYLFATPENLQLVVEFLNQHLK